MNILFLTENFPPETNAAATRVYERAVYWAKWGHNVTVITCHPNFPEGRLYDGWPNPWTSRAVMDGINVVRVKTFIAANRGVARRTLDFMSFGAAGLFAALRGPKPDVIAATSPQFFAAVAGWAAGALRRVPFAFELGDLWPASIAAVGAVKAPWLLRPVEMLELHMYKRAACVAALTAHFKDNLIRRGVPPAKIAVVRNGVDLPRYSPRPRDAALAHKYGLEGKFVVGYAGTHGMAHGLMNVVEAASLLRKRDDIRILLAGGGAEREMIAAAKAERGLNNLVMIPPAPKETMPAVWSLMDAALVHLKDSPLFSGVIPSKMFEAMGMGLPVIYCAPTGEASGVLEAAGAGLTVPPGAPAALAAAVERLADDNALRARLAAASLASAPHHSREVQAQRMLGVLEAAAAGEGARVSEIVKDADA
ncbi:MAG: glycosyltransferase family 4 protein [Rhodospirillales bacterium]